MFQWFYQTVFGGISELFASVGSFGTDLFSLPWVQAFLSFFERFGWAMYLAGLATAGFGIALDYQTTGHVSVRRQVLPMGAGLLAAHLLTVVPVRLYVFCCYLQGIFWKELALVSGGTATGDGWASSLLEGMQDTVSVTNLFFLLAVAYCVLKCVFGNIGRGGILLTQIAVGSLYLFSLPRGNTEGFCLWMKQVIALCLTSFLQMTLLYLGLITWAENPLLGLGVLIAANEVPRVADRFGLETGMRTGIGNLVTHAQTAVRTVKAFAV